MANILNTDTVNLIAAERSCKDRHRYCQRNIDHYKRNVKSQPYLVVASHSYDPSFVSYIKMLYWASIDGKFFGFEEQDSHTLSRQEGRNELQLHNFIHNFILERKHYRPDPKELKWQPSSEVEESIQEFALSDIPEEVKAPVFEETASLVRDIFVAAQHNIPIVEVLEQKLETLRRKGGVVFVGEPRPAETGQAPDLSEIPRWQGRKQDGMPLDFIQTHYGQWLSAFGAEQDAVFQDQVRKHDPKLLQGVISQLRRKGEDRKIKDFIKPRSARTDRELQSINSASLKHADRLSAAKRMRQARSRVPSKPSSE